MKRRFFIFLLSIGFIVSVVTPARAGMISNGVYHEAKSQGGHHIQEMSINLTKEHTTVDAIFPQPIQSLRPVSQLASNASKPGYRVVGAINASFFHFNSKLPSYLLARDGVIQHLGAVSSKSNDFMYRPAAFGMLENNRAQIAPFHLTPQITAGGKTAQAHSFNRERQNDEMILYTSSWAYDRTRTNATGLEVVVETPKNVEQQIAFGEKVTGKVVGIRPHGQYTSALIPKNGRGFVVSAHGKAVDGIRHLKKGDTVDLSYRIDTNWQNARFMLASGPLLVQNGKVNMTIDHNSPRARQVTDRTAVVTNKDGTQVKFVTVGRQNGGKGMTLQQFARYLQRNGAYQALNLDGGGSTTMVHRPVGEVLPVASSRKGGERSVHGILAAISTAPYGEAIDVNISQAEKGIVAIGSSVGYQVNYALDRFYNVLPLHQNEVKAIYATGDVGIVEDGKFTATKEGRGTVVVEYRGKRVSVPVQTIAPKEMIVSPERIRVAPGQSVQLSGRVKAPNNEHVIFNNARVSFEVPSSLGTLKDNTFTAGNEEGEGVIRARIGHLTKSIPVVISRDPVRVGSFESTNGLKARSARGTASIQREPRITAYDKNHSLRVNYTFDKSNETSAAYVDWERPFTFTGAPEAIGVAVYNNGRGHWVRAQLKDANGKAFTVNFNRAGDAWYGWKRLQANIPTNVRHPITIESLYFAETDASKKGKGFLLFDELTAYYDKDVALTPNFSEKDATMTVDGDKTFTVTFTQPMNDTVEKTPYTYIENDKGERIDVQIERKDNRTILVTPSSYLDEGTYRLTVTHFVQNAQNRAMNDDHTLFFNVR